MAFEKRIEFLTCRGCASVRYVRRTVGGPEVTFTNVRVAADRAVMLWSVGIDVPSEFEQARWVPLGVVGHYLREEVLESF